MEIRCRNTHAAFILLLFVGGWPSLLTNRNCFGGGRVGDAPLTMEDIVPPRCLVGESHLTQTHSHVGFRTIEGRRIVQELEEWSKTGRDAGLKLLDGRRLGLEASQAFTFLPPQVAKKMRAANPTQLPNKITPLSNPAPHATSLFVWFIH